VSLSLALQLVEAVTPAPVGTTTLVAVGGPDDVAVAQRWCDATGNHLLSVHPDAVEILRGRLADPIQALPADRRPGHRLWIYTNFHCNLACDYCCVGSSPTAAPRIIGVPEFAYLVTEAVTAGVRELYVTGGEPFMLLDLDERLSIAARALPTTVLTNAMTWNGARRARLEALPRHGLTLQISLDSATPELHDRHRGPGSFARARAGIETAIELGFRVRVAATLGADAGRAEDELIELFDKLGLAPDQQVIRRVAQQGAANQGLAVSRESLIPEVCITASGVYWHPVAATDPAMKVADRWAPLQPVIESIRDEYRMYRIRGEITASTFPCA